jgi:triacylglycerol lipase
MAQRVDTAIGVLNGVIGDYLKRKDNSLAIPMQVICRGQPIDITSDAIAASYPRATPRLALLVHGLMSTERAWEFPGGETYGSWLARDLGYTPLYLRYNTGLHISENGEALDLLLEQLVNVYPIQLEEIVLVGHSMGGLVLRSATRSASDHQRRWLDLTRRAFYLGTPHLGVPSERLGNLVTWSLKVVGNPVTKLVGEILDLRSSGVKDLRYGNLRREDWEGVDADALLQNRRHPVPLLPQIDHYLIAGAVSADPYISLLFGDAIVPLRSATGRAKPADRSPPFPQQRVRVMPPITHPRLARDSKVYEQIRAWCREPR